ncbi:MAG: heme-copper oxidase subunit III [Anaerolineales bacterium]|nr:heme-copper oxidase subunit III [Anaerolineales bacterium]
MQHANKSSVLNLGLTVFLFLVVLTGLEFFIAAVVGSALLLTLTALLKAGMVLYFYMHSNHLLTDETDIERDSYLYILGTNRLGLWLFLLSDSFVFGGLMVARFNLLGPTRPELNQILGLAVTAVLLVSSFFMNRAEVSMEYGDRKGFLIGTSATLLLGFLFLAGVVGVEWRLAMHEGLTPSSGVAGAIFYMMTGMHAFHVLTGVFFLAIILSNGLRGKYTAERHWGVEAAAVYWHFVDVVWIFFYPALYLIGSAG